MIECQSCHTLNAEAESSCLACGAVLSAPASKEASTRAAARCPAGHPIDPIWRTCPYCERQQAGTGIAPAAADRSADHRTRLEGEAPSPEPTVPPFGPRPTRLDEPEPSSRRTVLREAQPGVGIPPPAGPEPPRDPAPAQDRGVPARRLVAVLAAPGLGTGGAVFPVRSGKSVIGADRSSDVQLPGDSEVSREHAVILHRNGTFHLTDRLSSNGTWLNGEEVPANGTVPLRDRDCIRCGRTELLFLMIEAAESSDRLNP